MLQTSEVTVATELASLYNVTQPRLSHVRVSALLATDLQEALLNLPAETAGRGTIIEKAPFAPFVLRWPPEYNKRNL